MANILIQNNYIDIRKFEEIRNIALETKFTSSEEWHQRLNNAGIYIDVGWRGNRSGLTRTFKNPILDDLNKKILNTTSNYFHFPVNEVVINSYFHYSSLSTKETLSNFEYMKYHTDNSMIAGLIYLVPNPPEGTGTSILNAESNKIINVENVYNRLISYPSYMVHGPTDLFGDGTKENSRMTFTFFLYLKSKMQGR